MIDDERLIGSLPADRAGAALPRQQGLVLLRRDPVAALDLGRAAVRVPLATLRPIFAVGCVPLAVLRGDLLLVGLVIGVAARERPLSIFLILGVSLAPLLVPRLPRTPPG